MPSTAEVTESQDTDVAETTSETAETAETTQSIETTQRLTGEPAATTEKAAKEGTKTHEPPPDSPRFQDIYGKYKDLERKAASYESDMQEMKSFNENLRENLKKFEQQTIDVRSKSATGGIDSQMSALKSQKKQAFESGDYELLSDIDDKMYELREQKRDLGSQSNKSVLFGDDTTKETTAKTDHQKKTKAKDDYDHWIGDNPKFVDQGKFEKLSMIENELVTKPEYKDKWHVTTWNAAARIYDERYENDPPASDSVGNPAMSRKASKSVKTLNDAQRRVAARLEMSEEDYAKNM